MLLYLPYSNGVAFKSNKFMIKLNLSAVLENVKSDDKQIKNLLKILKVSRKILEV